MKDMYVNSNESMVFKLVVSLEQWGKNEPLESPHTYIYCIVVLTLGTHNPCKVFSTYTALFIDNIGYSYA